MTPLTFSPYEILKGRTVVGSFFGGLKPKTDVPRLLQKYMDKVNEYARIRMLTRTSHRKRARIGTDLSTGNVVCETGVELGGIRYAGNRV